MGTTLITGASGFVGRFLMDEMKRQGLHFLGVARTPAPGIVPITSYDQETDWSHLLAGVECVVHLAARVHVMREKEQDPAAAFHRSNVEATLHLAQAAVRAGVRRFVYISSIKVNGERTRPCKPFRFDDPHLPEDDYARSKSEAEQGLHELAVKTGLEVVVIRPPLIYGPGVKGNFSTLVKWARSGLPSPFRRIENKRSLVHVRNLCDLIITCLSHPNAANQTYLVSDGFDISTDQLLGLLANACGRKMMHVGLIPSTFVPLLCKTNVGNKLLGSLQVDITKTQQSLDWSPTPFIGFDDAVGPATHQKG